ncbi:MFS transporter [Phreatobacter stygius]|uniref:MFS transporter n=1 Tax=Phreatobacter stygius TaxID=1940610 RepID=A0A4D7BI02_9HYPH|nr:MFS transporter [Phreatobacter stygius]QCI68706.1 MFS transporter [Phreatobacter stygius]
MPSPPVPTNPATTRVAGLLAITQVFGWGTTYYLPSTMAGPLTAELGLTGEGIFAGISVMLLVSAVVAPRLGRVIDRHGAHWPMVAGSLLMAIALVILSRATGLVSYLAAWVVIGIGTPLSLTQAATAALAQLDRQRARQSIGLLMLMGGLSSTVFWPLTAWLNTSIGWRDTCLLFALAQLVVCLPIHAFGLRVSNGRNHADSVPGEPATAALSLTPADRRKAFILMAAGFSLTGFVSWGLPLHVIGILEGYGHSAAFAVAAGALMGPAQVSARLAEMTFGKRHGILTIGVVSAAIMPVAVALPVIGNASPAIAIGFVVGYGLAAGAMTIVRNVAPLALFGWQTYATMTGWLSLPQNIVFAISPMIFAALIRHSGPTAALIVAFGAALAALGVMIMLERHFRRATAGGRAA